MLPLAAMGAMATQGASAPQPAGTGGRADPRLPSAAHEFEACLMKEFLKPLQKDALSDDGGDGSGSDGADSSDGSNNALMSFGSEALARAISDRGGFGIATKIIEQLGAKPAAGETTVASEDSLTMGGKEGSRVRVLRR
jgi:Rod binding domain-containing protein